MIRLHYLEGCPFCIRVQDKLDKMELAYELVDAEADNFAEVLQIAEYDMVPVLVDGNRNGIFAASSSYGSNRFGPFYLLCDPSICSCFTIRNRTNCFPHFLLEGGS